MQLLKKQWLRWHLARSREGDTAVFSRLYRLEDPWDLNKPSEQFRFQETSRVIRTRIGEHFGSVLEIGCGEGLQTKYLASLAGRIVGLDPSRRAIKRARAMRIPNATFAVCGLETFVQQAESLFNLVTACEVIYYFEDLESVYQRMSRLGEICVVTYYEGESESLDRFFSTKTIQSETIRGMSCKWRVVWWVN